MRHRSAPQRENVRAGDRRSLPRAFHNADKNSRSRGHFDASNDEDFAALL
jgi:hypothetical protein